VQVSTFASWEDVGHWYQQLQKEQVAVTPAITAKATELTKGLTTDDQKLRAIYDFVSLHVHYIGLDFGIGRYQPHAAEDVLGNEYGDCKDKHTLLAALLKAAGFDAWPALIHTSQKLDPDVPSLTQFNHVITVVPRGKDLIWLDTTAEVAPYGLLIPQLRDKQAMVMPTGKPPVLMSTPADPPFPQEQRFTATARLSADGVLIGHISQRYRGDVEHVLRLALRQIPEAKWKDAIQNISHGMGFAGDVSNVVISPIEELDKPLEISYDYNRKDFADWEHKQILALIPPIGIEAVGFQRKTPKVPVYLGAIGDLVYHSEIELPPGSSLIPPKDLDLVEPYAEYHTQNVLEGGKLKTTRRLVLKKTEVPVADWEQFKKMSKTVSEDSFNYMPLSGLGDGMTTSAANISELDVKFREATEALQRRDAQRAKELLQQIIAAEPKYHGAHFNLAIALAGTGGMNEALEEFQKEEELTPDDPRSYHAAAGLAVATFRRDFAIAQLRKLLKTNPTDREGALQLSSLLSADGKYAESVEVLEKALERSPESPSLQFSLGNAYAKNGDITKAVPHLQAAAEAAEKSAEIDYMQLNNVAYTLTEANAELELAKHCIEKALHDLDTRSSSASKDGSVRLKLTRDYSYLWDTAGWVYFKLGDATTAESYVHASWLIGQQGVVGEHLAQIYEKQTSCSHIRISVCRDAECAVSEAGGTWAWKSFQRKSGSPGKS
jgi:tetratricopeptide (TPR) repeat protein